MLQFNHKSILIKMQQSDYQSLIDGIWYIRFYIVDSEQQKIKRFKLYLFK